MKKIIHTIVHHIQSRNTDKKIPAAQPLRHYTARSPQQKRGERGEQIARDYLVGQGLSFVDANMACPLGEIDLLMRDGETLVFVEVKWRKNAQFGGAVNAIGGQKLARLRRTIEYYLQQHPSYQHLPCRIDAVLIQGDGTGVPTIDWLVNIDAE